jgi:hypothetical protein
MDYTEELDEGLRLRLAEKIPEPGSASDTIAASSSLLQATVLGWQMKAAELSRLVDTEEGDSKRKLSQRYTQAEKMVKVWQVHLATYEGAPSGADPVVGVPIEYLRPNENEDPDLIPHAYPNYPQGF